MSHLPQRTNASEPAPETNPAGEPHEHTLGQTDAEDRVPVLKRVAYGMGNLADHIGTGTLIGNANPIFNVALGLDPRLIGLALAIMRLWDSFTDPLMGSISDNTRSSYGRRIPFIFIGAIGCGIAFPLVWMIPHGLSELSLFAWFLGFSMLFFTFQTMYTVPHTALGFELTPDIDERTRVMEMRAYLGKLATLFAPWAYAFTQMPIWGGDTLLGTRYMGLTYGLIILVIGIIPALSLKERFFRVSKQQRKITFLKSVSMTFRNIGQPPGLLRGALLPVQWRHRRHVHPPWGDGKHHRHRRSGRCIHPQPPFPPYRQTPDTGYLPGAARAQFLCQMDILPALQSLPEPCRYPFRVPGLRRILAADLLHQGRHLRL
jgi:hypothetical protein